MSEMVENLKLEIILHAYKMAYPGLTFAIMVGVAIGTAIYYYFNQENNQQQRQNQYYYDDYDSSEYPTADVNNAWGGTRSSSSGSQRRKRRNSTSKCSICLDDINKGKIKTISECGHEFHEHCITMWFRQNKICPNCRQPVYS